MAFLDGMKRFIALHSLQESDKFYVEILIVPLKEKMINRTKSKLASELVEILMLNAFQVLKVKVVE